MNSNQLKDEPHPFTHVILDCSFLAKQVLVGGELAKYRDEPVIKAHKLQKKPTGAFDGKKAKEVSKASLRATKVLFFWGGLFFYTHCCFLLKLLASFLSSNSSLRKL